MIKLSEILEIKSLPGGVLIAYPQGTGTQGYFKIKISGEDFLSIQKYKNTSSTFLFPSKDRRYGIVKRFLDSKNIGYIERITKNGNAYFISIPNKYILFQNK